ncbi:MAG: ATP-binding protein [Bryobacteraceae bacterium]
MDFDRQELREFLLRACHDLRAPLRAVRATSELLVKLPDKREGPDFDQLLGLVVNGAIGANSLVDGITNYALALQVQLSARPVPTRALLGGVLVQLAPEIRAAGAEITYDELPLVTGDADRLMQLFENLVRNAIQYRGEAAPRVHVGAREEDGRWTLSVGDNGAGIDAQDLERIFRPFERMSRKRDGAGLGLAICREIVRGHGGRIWAESELGQGTTIYFTLETA